jgi:predicted dehydrogenase
MNATNNAAPLRWGILGPGSIARKFAEDLRHLPEAGRLVAVGSRSKEKADAFADEYGASNRHGSYEALAADPDVDAIYVATPHPMHREHSILALRGGKAVLCEKPFTVNARELEEVVAVARETGRFLMEAHWSRLLPANRKVAELVASGAIGEVRMVQADFGFRAGVNPTGRLFDPALGGGALLDVGCYCVSLAVQLLGREFAHVASHADIGSTGVDEQAALILGYPNGALGLLSTAIRTNTPHTAFILGTEGRITVPKCWGAKSLTLSRSGKDDESWEFPYEGSGKQFEAAEVARCVTAGETESQVIPLADSLAILRAMDAARAQWGLKYPME